jgi:phosphomannomutase
MNVFKAFDIRGIYPAEMNEEFAYNLGRAVVSYLGCSTLMVGRDVRDSGRSLFDAFCRGVTAQGCTVRDIGICSTPMLYFASRQHDAAMITASHLPPDYNGFKICRKGAIAIGQDNGLREIEKIMAAAKFEQAAVKGKIVPLSITDDYIADVLTWGAGIDKRLRVVVDAGNGSEGVVIRRICQKAGVELIPLFFEQDGRFPGRGPNPVLPGAQDALRKAVVENKADCGAAFDGDCDRVLFVDERGRSVRADLLIALLAEQLLKQHPHATILYDLRSSRAVSERIAELGGTPFITRVGHSFIKEMMREKDAIFAGELTGHYYYARNSFADSGDITLMLVLGLIASSGRKLSDLIRPLQRYSHSGELDFRVDDVAAVIARLEERYRDGRQTRIDGLSVDYDDWWFNVRPSTMEPLLRLNCEAKTLEMLREKVKQIEAIIHSKPVKE